MEQVKQWAFIFEKDQFFRLSLNKILKKYGFEVVEIEDFSELEGRKKDVEEGMVLADVEIDVLERWLPLIRKWNDRFILMTPLVSDDLSLRTRKMGIQHILKKPVEPKSLRRVIQKFGFSDQTKNRSLGKRREGFRCDQKGGEDG
jgi:FixJ family two-component response regulator